MFRDRRVGRVRADDPGPATMPCPSASLDRSRNPRIDEVGRLLDEKLARLAEAGMTRS
ncbi:MAG: hypothetical protein JO355_11460 [Planctomycetaceae bacterium]|nr:hypothetical protein [Planctomycetaceae bacterium]MBV8677768.1 hypothetical protein [Planctomycetaceae bacterium]